LIAWPRLFDGETTRRRALEEALAQTHRVVRARREVVDDHEEPVARMRIADVLIAPLRRAVKVLAGSAGEAERKAEAENRQRTPEQRTEAARDKADAHLEERQARHDAEAATRRRQGA
jgi:hypothetical protein